VAAPTLGQGGPTYSELLLPSSKEEFVEYEWRKRAKEIIDRSAAYAADVLVTPWWMWVFAAMFMMVFGSFAVSALGTHVEIARAQNASQQAACQMPPTMGVRAPWC
jgi:hypothetical protein